MKDLLSLSFQLKKLSVASEWTAFDAVQQFQPLLAALAASKGVSEGSMIGLLLAQYLQSLGAAKCGSQLPAIAAKCIPEATEETEESVKMESGALDKVSDDCLKLALEYLDFDDRCNGAEPSCHRLFALSRAAPIHCWEFDAVANYKMDIAKVAHRFHAKHYIGLSEGKSTADYIMANPALAGSILQHFGQFATDLRIDDDCFEQIGDVSFPNVTRVFASECLQLLSRVLSNCPMVNQLTVCGFRNENEMRAALKCISDTKGLRKVKFYNYLSQTLVVNTSGFDFSHICDLNVAGDCTMLSHILCPNLERLTLSGTCLAIGTLAELTMPRALRYLDTSLYRGCANPRWRYSQIRVFAPPCKIHTLVTSTHSEDLAQIYDDYSPTRLTVKIRPFDADYSVDLDECLHRLASKLVSGNADAMVLEFQWWNRFDSANIRPLFVWLSQISGIIKTRIEVRIAEDLWKKVALEMKPYLVESLKASVTLNFSAF